MGFGNGIKFVMLIIENNIHELYKFNKYFHENSMEHDNIFIYTIYQYEK